MDQKRVFSENKVGIYLCPNCNTKFPFTGTNQKLEMVKSGDLLKLKTEYVKSKRLNEDLVARSSLLQEENGMLKEKLALIRLEGIANALTKEISALRIGKEVLDNQISTFIPDFR